MPPPNPLTQLAGEIASLFDALEQSLKSPEATIDPKIVADAVVYMAGLPLDANVLTMTVMANKMPFVGRG